MGADVARISGFGFQVSGVGFRVSAGSYLRLTDFCITDLELKQVGADVAPRVQEQRDRGVVPHLLPYFG